VEELELLCAVKGVDLQDLRRKLNSGALGQFTQLDPYECQVLLAALEVAGGV
jgi:hypothetical protein